MEIERRVLIGFAAGRYPFISGASQPGEGDGAVWFIPESDHKAKLEQAIAEYRERLLGEGALDAAQDAAEDACVYTELDDEYVRLMSDAAVRGALDAALSPTAEEER